MSIFKRHSNFFLKHITIALIIALGAIGITSCSTDDDSIVNLPNESAAVLFHTVVDKDIQTRGASMDNDALKSESFGVLAYYTQNNAWSAAAATATPNFMYNQKVAWSTTNTTWNYSPMKYWPNNTNDKVSFFAYAPYEETPATGANKGIKLSSNTTNDTPAIDFTVNSNITNQVDLVYASAKDKNKEVVDFQFKHALSRIGFSAKAADDYGPTTIKVKSISISGKFYPSGKLNLLDGTWNDVSATDVTYKKEGLDITLNNATEQQLFGEEQYLMIIPKNFTGVNDKIKVTINYTSTTNGIVSDVISKDVFIDEKNFEQSEAYKFALNISLNQNITLLPESNSYIVAPNGATLKIPVSRANQSMIGDQLVTGDVFTAELVWTDNSNKIAPNSNIKSISVEGTGPTGFLVVEPGSAEGNAVVAIKNASGKILWSWHIWVTDYAPTFTGPGSFMDRNLGAMSNNPVNWIDNLGLMYQWGRKDPFPGSSAIYSYNATEIFNKDGVTKITEVNLSEKVGNKVNGYTGPNNLSNSISNPLAYYYINWTGYLHDWYIGPSQAQNNDLWSPTTKTVYDPCPPGWRVPKKDDLRALNNSSNFKTEKGESPIIYFGRRYINDNYGGFYPATGNAPDHNSYTNLEGFNTTGGVWSSEASRVDTIVGTNLGKLANALRFSLDSDGVVVLGTYFENNKGVTKPNNRAMGLPVRCVRE